MLLMASRRDVWADLEFFERALEFASDGYQRRQLSRLIAEAKEKIVKSIERDFIEGAISAQTFKNIMGHRPCKELALRCLARYKYKTTPIEKNGTMVFARKAFESLAKLPS
jgi:hypothetical protein